LRNPIISFFQNRTYKTDDISAKHHIAELIAKLARAHNAKIIVETGTFRGLTTLELAKENPQATIYTFEIDPKILRQTRILFGISGHRNIVLVEGDVMKTLPQTIAGKSVDFAFLDDAKKNYRMNFENLLPHLSDSALVCAHDTNFRPNDIDDAIQFGKYLANHPAFSAISVDWSDRGLTIAQKRGSARIEKKPTGGI